LRKQPVEEALKSPRLNPYLYEYKGKEQSLSEWSEELSIPYATLIKESRRTNSFEECVRNIQSKENEKRFLNDVFIEDISKFSFREVLYWFNTLEQKKVNRLEKKVYSHKGWKQIHIYFYSSLLLNNSAFQFAETFSSLNLTWSFQSFFGKEVGYLDQYRGEIKCSISSVMELVKESNKMKKPQLTL
jgi:hypothetical protein